jgi:hypothetical protein
MAVPIRAWDNDADVSIGMSEQRARYFGGRLYESCDSPAGVSATGSVAAGTIAAAANTVTGEVVAWRNPGAITADVVYGESGVVVVAGAHVASARGRGTVTFETCGTPDCPLTITALRLYADDFELRDVDIRGFAVWNHGPVVGVPAGDGTYSISGQSRFDVAGFIDGDASGLSTQPGSIALAAFDGRTFALAFAVETDKATVVVIVKAIAHDVPPIARLSAPAVVECAASDGTIVTLDASQSTDGDGDIAGYLWEVNGRVLAFGPEAIQSVLLPLGSTRVPVKVFDSRGARSTASATIVVQDTVPPVITSTSPDVCIWPPSHDMRLFTSEGLGLVVTDACDPFPKVSIAELSPVMEDARGDGSTEIDEVVGTGAFCVRSERAGPVEEGRTYAVQVLARDGACNEGVARVNLHVPHDLGATSCPPGGRTGGEIVPDGSSACLVSAPLDACTAAAPPPDSSVSIHTTAAVAPDDGMSQSCSSGGPGHLFALLSLLALRRRTT